MGIQRATEPPASRMTGGKHRAGPRKSSEVIDGFLGSHWEKLQKLAKITKVRKCIIDYKIDHLAS